MALYNRELRSITSLDQNAAQEEPEHLFEEPDKASLSSGANSLLIAHSELTRATSSAHLSFLYPTNQDSQSSFHCQSEALGVNNLLPRKRSALSDAREAVGVTVATCSYDALTSLTEHVDKGESRALAASWWYILPRMLDKQLQQMSSEHQQRRLLSHRHDEMQFDKGLHHQKEEHRLQQQQMLNALQHMNDLRNELRAMDNHLFQLISYCLVQGNLMETQPSKLSPQLPDIQEASQPNTYKLPANTFDLRKQVNTPSSATPQVVAQLPVPSPVNQTTSEPVETPKRIVNLKKLRLLASAHLYSSPTPSVDDTEDKLQIKCNESIRTTSGHMIHVPKKRRLTISSDGQPLATSVYETTQPPVKFPSTTTLNSPAKSSSPTTATYPANQNLIDSLYSSYLDSAKSSVHESLLPAPIVPSYFQSFHPVALDPALYHYSNDVHRVDSYCNPQHDTGVPTDKISTTNHPHNFMMSSTERDYIQHNHHLSMLSETTIQTLNQRQQKMPFRCQVCGSGFEDKHRLQQHLSIHLSLHPSWFEEKTIKETMVQYESKRGDYLCSVCQIRYDTTAEFDKHMQLHGDKPHRCDLCDQDNKIVSFRYFRQLLTHLRSHCFLYSCRFVSECKQTANRKDYLKLHILKHHLNNKLPDQHIVWCHWKIRKTTGSTIPN